MWPTLDIPDTAQSPFTDYSRWRLVVQDAGDRHWVYLKTSEECDRWPQTEVDKYWLGIPLVRAGLTRFADVLNVI